MQKLLTLIIVTMALAASVDAKAPVYDPWYYRDARDPLFIVPDKAQHFYGSAALATVSQKIIGKEAGTLLSVGAGLLWEINDNRTGAGFSWKDLTADCLGVLTARLAPKSPVVCWLNYSDIKKQITINAAIRF